MPLAIVPFVALSAALHLRAEYAGPRWQVYLFKPLTMVLILLIAGASASEDWRYTGLIQAGLLASLAGDIFLLLPKRFLAGLVAFLIAHLLYSAAFATHLRALSGWPLIPLLLYGGVIYSRLAPSLHRLKVAVLLYVLAILLMAWLAWEQAGGPANQLAFGGAILFVASDTILAINRFHRRFRWAQALILSTYFGAQCLIALSIGGRPPS